ncbi:hypothetical protein B0O80DRAFT_499985 [Mortierella sp. GBAus27b]|nr:hypothetical protein B0O80DRAFT_499985 [Mortierella sp. GBAus27b]
MVLFQTSPSQECFADTLISRRIASKLEGIVDVENRSVAREFWGRPNRITDTIVSSLNATIRT